MVNPLGPPSAVVEALAELPRTLAALARSADHLASAVEHAERLNETGDRVLASMERAERVADKLIESGEQLVESVGRAERLGDKLVASADKLVEASSSAEKLADRLVASASAAGDEARLAREVLESTRPIAEQLRDTGPQIIEASHQARGQLAETRQVLERASALVERVLDMSGPLERLMARVSRGS